METRKTDKLFRLLQQRYACLLELETFSQKQNCLIESNKIDDLLELLASKQHAIDSLTRVNKQLFEFESEKPEDRNWKTEEHRQKCAGLVDVSEQLLAQIIKQEKLCEESIATCKQKAEVRLKGFTHASSVRAAYSQIDKPVGQSLDFSTDT